MSKVALIIGIAGQDGTLLSEFLLKKRYNVYGITRNSLDKSFNSILSNFVITNKVKILNCNILNDRDLKKNIIQINPTEIYYLATTHEVSMSNENFVKVMDVNVKGLFSVLETIRSEKLNSRVFYAASSNVFSGSKNYPQHENTPMSPLSLYSVAKSTAIDLINYYKNNFEIFSCFGILYNHESSLRKDNFVTMKIVKSALKIKFGQEEKIILGNIQDKKDWGCAKDFVRAMWLMLQPKKPKNYIIGTGKLTSVKDILNYTFNYLDLSWKNYLIIDEKLFRKKSNIPLIADFSKIKKDLGWAPSKNFDEVIRSIIEDVKIQYINK